MVRPVGSYSTDISRCTVNKTLNSLKSFRDVLVLRMSSSDKRISRKMHHRAFPEATEKFYWKIGSCSTRPTILMIDWVLGHGSYVI